MSDYYYDDPKNDPYDDLHDTIMDLNTVYNAFQQIEFDKDAKVFYLKRIEDILAEIEDAKEGILSRVERNENEK